MSELDKLSTSSNYPQSISPSWAEETIQLIKSHASLEDMQELVELLEAYLEEESQEGMKT